MNVGDHSRAPVGSRLVSKSLPSAKDGLVKLVLQMNKGAWKGYLSRSRMSKLNLSIEDALSTADLSISSYICQ